jgi:cytoskeletal protein CcmA (bactofilin family)
VGERWQQRRVVPPKPAAPRPIPARAPEAGLIGWREIRTVLDTGTQVNGKLSFTAPTRIEGRLRGEVRAADLLEVAACGVVHGSIWAKSLVVAGEVRGQVLGADRVEIQAGGRVFGLIETRALVVMDGAVFEGDLRMNLDETAVELDQPARG